MKMIAALLVAFLPSLAFAQGNFQVSTLDIEQAVAQALVEKGVSERVKASVIGDRGTVYSHTQPLTVGVKGLQFDKTSRRWTANLTFQSGEQIISAMPAGGRFEEMMMVPTLKRQFKNGDIIAAADIKMIEFPVGRVRSEMLTDGSKLIGQSPRRIVSAGRPIRQEEITSPAVVKKNGFVQLSYKSGGVEITTGGQAMEAGGPGDVIPVKNVTSKQIVRAIIQDAQTVNVMTPATQSSALETKSYAN